MQILNESNPNGDGKSYKMNLCSTQEFNRISKQILKKVYELHGINQQPIIQKRMQLNKEIVIGKFYKWELFHHRTCRRSAISMWFYNWKLTPTQIGALIGTRKLEVLNVYIAREKEHKVKLLENI